MTTYVDEDGDGLPRCLWCADGECVSTGEICEDWVCRCGCKLRPVDPFRAEQLDQRPDTALANIARDIEAERYDAAALTAERFGRPTRSRA